MEKEKVDIAIIGAGIVGLATALSLSERFPRYSIGILEKEPRVADHQTGHNSGVIHAGIYYKPGSYKARLCVGGVQLLTRFCEENGVPYEHCGKLIVATDVSELPRLEMLHQRGVANGIQGLQVIPQEHVREIEPHARAVRALYSPSTGIVDFRRVSEAMAARLADKGVGISTGAKVERITRSNGVLRIGTSAGEVVARNLISCAGLYSDRIARMMGVDPGVQIIPFRGEYYSLREDQKLVHNLIYPVPDPEFPFLGVHFTRRITGEFEAGPNAVLAFAREGYRATALDPGEILQMLGYRGFWAMGWHYWRMGFYEFYRSFSRQAFLKALQKLVPELQDRDLVPGGSGVRAQAVTPNGRMVDDFKIVEAPGAVHVLNAPSPAATASLAIGGHIADLASKSFSL